MALLTKAQREWIDLKKVIDRQKPLKQPLDLPTSTLGKWCYDRAVQNYGWWARTMTVFFILHILVLMYVCSLLHHVDVTHVLFEKKDSNLHYKHYH